MFLTSQFLKMKMTQQHAMNTWLTMTEFLQINSCQQKPDSQNILLVMKVTSFITLKMFIMHHIMTQTQTQKQFMVLMMLMMVTSLWHQSMEQTQHFQTTMCSMKQQMIKPKWTKQSMQMTLIGHGNHLMKREKLTLSLKLNFKFLRGMILLVGMFKLNRLKLTLLMTNTSKLMLNTKMFLTSTINTHMVCSMVASIMNLNTPIQTLIWKEIHMKQLLDLNSLCMKMKMVQLDSDSLMHTQIFMFMRFIKSLIMMLT